MHRHRRASSGAAAGALGVLAFAFAQIACVHGGTAQPDASNGTTGATNMQHEPLHGSAMAPSESSGGGAPQSDTPKPATGPERDLGATPETMPDASGMQNVSPLSPPAGVAPAP